PRRRGAQLVPGQLTSPGRLSPRLLAERLSSNCHVLGRPQPSTYDPLSPRLVARPLGSNDQFSPRLVARPLGSNDQFSPRLVARPLGSNNHVRLGLRPPSGLVWLAIWPGTLRDHLPYNQHSLEAH